MRFFRAKTGETKQTNHPTGKRWRQGINTTEMLTLLRHLSMTMHAGVPLIKALTILEADQKKRQKILLSHLRSSVESGFKLADGMETAPVRFPELVITMVRTGEVGGTLELSLQRVMHRIERSKELKRKVLGALAYPVMILAMVVGLALAMGLLVLPQVTPLFESMGNALPLPTQIMMNGSDFLQARYKELGIGVLLFLVTYWLVMRIERVRSAQQRFFLRMPILNTIIRLVAITNMLGTFSSLLQSGVKLQDCIANAAKSTGVIPFRKSLARMLPMVEEGKSFSDGMRLYPHLFPSFVISLVNVGEQTGSMGETCEYLAEYCQVEAEHSIKQLLTILEPVLLITVGGLVGGAVLAVIAPIYSLTGSL